MRTRTKRAGAVLALLVVALALPVLGATGAHAQSTCVMSQAYQGTAVISANPTTVSPGSTVTIAGTGWPPASTVSIAVNGTAVADTTTDGAGDFSLDYTVPSSQTGALNISVACGGFSQSTSVNVQFSVTSQTAPPGGGTTGGTLTRTGSDSLGLAQLGLALIAVGGLVVIASRRRARNAHDARA